MSPNFVEASTLKASSSRNSDRVAVRRHHEIELARPRRVRPAVFVNGDDEVDPVEVRQFLVRDAVRPAPVIVVTDRFELVAVAGGVRLERERAEPDRFGRIAIGRCRGQRGVVHRRRIGALRYVFEAAEPGRREHERTRVVVQKCRRQRDPRALRGDDDVLARRGDLVDRDERGSGQRAVLARLDVELDGRAIERRAVVELMPSRIFSVHSV